MPLNQDQLRQALDRIAARDSEVARALDEIGYPSPRSRPAGFETLVAIIVSQQLSNRAAATIMSRVRECLPVFDARALLDLPEGTLRTAGLSARKVSYATGLAELFVAGRFDPHALEALADEDVVREIVALRGFGRWSAEVYLMFSLHRPDVFPADDLALRKGLQKLKGLDQELTAASARDLVSHWSPWRSAGSLFLWHYYQGAPA